MDKAFVGVKRNWKELWLIQPAAASCSDHTASALWLNSSVYTLFLLAQDKCLTVHVAARKEDAFQIKMKQRNMDERNIRKMFHGASPFPPHLPRCVMSLHKVRLTPGP